MRRPRPSRRWFELMAAVFGAWLALGAGCGRGREENVPPEAGTRTSSAEEETPMKSGDFTLTSSAFAAEATIPAQHTCDGEDVSPPLAWSGTPAGTVSLALLCDDPDAPRGTWVHWVLYNIDPAVTTLGTGIPGTAAVAGGARHGANDFGQLGYDGPCPPRGPAHRYFFRLFALDCTLDLPAGATMKQLLAGAEGHILARAELMGRYGR